MVQDGGEPGNSIHRSFKDDNERQFDRAHAVRIVEDSLLGQVAGIKRGVVNSAHHQALGKLAEGLLANCYSDDGLVEGIEWADKKDKSFLLAVQWHPERMVDMYLHNSPLASNIRNHFIQEIKKSLL
jgi:putative glutamine amidotransferase